MDINELRNEVRRRGWRGDRRRYERDAGAESRSPGSTDAPQWLVLLVRQQAVPTLGAQPHIGPPID